MNITGRPASLEDEGYAAFWAGDLHRAVAMFHNLDTPGCAMMRARTFLRLKLYGRVIDEYTRRDLKTYDSREQSWLSSCAAAAYSVLGKDDQADDALAKCIDRVGTSAYRGQMALHSGSLFFMQIARVTAEEVHITAVNAVTDAENLPEVSHGPHYQADRLFLLARSYQSVGWIEGLRSNFESQRKHFMRAAATAADVRNPDRAAETVTLGSLATEIADQPFLEGVEYISSRVQAFPWTAHTSETELALRQALRSNALLFRDEDAKTRAMPKFASLLLASRLGDFAPTLMFARWENTFDYLEQLRYCVSIAADVDWKTAERQLPNLRLLAIVLAPFDIDIAQRFADMFYKRKVVVSRDVVGSREPRNVKLENLLDGALAKANGHFDYASRLFSKVNSILGSEEPVDAVAGIENYTITRAEADLDAARSFIQRFPSSSFSRRLRASMSLLGDAEAGDFPYLGMYGTKIRS